MSTSALPVLYVRVGAGVWHVLQTQQYAWCGRPFRTAAAGVTYAADRPQALCPFCAQHAPKARPDPQWEPLAYRRWLLEQWDAQGGLVWPADQEPHRRVLCGASVARGA